MLWQERVLRWKLEASNNGTTWILLYSTDTNHLLNAIKFFQPTIISGILFKTNSH